MKKVLLTAMTLVSIATSSVFGYYGANADWIDFLADGNQFRARTDKLGFVLGNGTIKGTFGFKAENGSLGTIFAPATSKDDNGKEHYFANFTPTVSAGIGYTTEAFGIGIGYNYTYRHKIDIVQGTPSDINTMSKNGIGLSIHTPVIAMNFLNNNLRIAVPVQIAMKDGDMKDTSDKEKYMGISLDPQIRYYTGMPAFSELRLTLYYGMNEFTSQAGEKASVSSFGFEFRSYFGAQAGDLKLSPFLKVVYNTALDKNSQYANYNIKAGSGITATKEAKDYYDSNPWKLEILPTLGMTANSDVVNLYLEAGLGYMAVNTGYAETSTHRSDAGNYGVEHALRWNAYGEIYLRPIQDLEWYFEAEIGNSVPDGVTLPSGVSGVYAGFGNGVQFNASTGITWYLPSFQE